MTDKPTLCAPTTLLFDWHGTLVNTLDAMYEAMEDMLEQLEALQLLERLVPEEQCHNPDDVKLLRYIRIFRRLHPKILAERRVSRTELFNALFGDDVAAKTIAHQAYNHCYRKYFGAVQPFQSGITHYLRSFKTLGLQLSIATNRSREFLDHELALVDGGQWQALFDTSVCADDVSHYKPHPHILHAALKQLGQLPGPHCWYVGDSYLDMVTAKTAGISAIFYNGGHYCASILEQLFSRQPQYRPDAIVDSLDQLMDLLEQLQGQQPGIFARPVASSRGPYFPPPQPPPKRQEPDWHPAVAVINRPQAILFDWHATLVDTLDAMYHAVDDMLPDMRRRGLLDNMAGLRHRKSPEDARLLDYVRSHAQLHPRIKADRKISRTDIFEVLFGDDQQSKQQAHQLFSHHYRNHYGTVLPFEPRVKPMLIALNRLLKVGVITNRDREFFEHELAAVEGSGWNDYFSCTVCGDDTSRRKPNPDQLIKAAHDLDLAPSPALWYVGDSTTDVIAAKRAGMTAVFFNGAQWDLPWLEKIFPGSEQHPHQPDVVVNDFSEFWALVLTCINR